MDFYSFFDKVLEKSWIIALLGLILGLIFTIISTINFYKAITNPFLSYTLIISNFERFNPPPHPLFVFKDNLECEALYSLIKEPIDRKILLTGLTSDSPTILKVNVGIKFKAKKIYETEKVLVIQAVNTDLLGAVETLHLDKKKGIFLRTISGFARGGHIYAEKGTCK